MEVKQKKHADDGSGQLSQSEEQRSSRSAWYCDRLSDDSRTSQRPESDRVLLSLAASETSERFKARVNQSV